MEKITVSKLLQRWPDRKAVWEDARAANPNLQLIGVHRWFPRESVPPGYWMALIAGAKRRNIYLTLEELAQAHAHINEQDGHEFVGFQGQVAQ